MNMVYAKQVYNRKEGQMTKNKIDRAAIKADRWPILAHVIEYCIKFRCLQYLTVKSWKLLQYQILVQGYSEEWAMDYARRLRQTAKIVEERKLYGNN